MAKNSPSKTIEQITNYLDVQGNNRRAELLRVACALISNPVAFQRLSTETVVDEAKKVLKELDKHEP